MIHKKTFAAWLAGCTVGLSLAALVHADPNHQTVDSPFAVHGTEFSPDLHKKASESYEAAKTKLLGFLEKHAKSDLQKVQAHDIGVAYVMASRLRRAADQLQILGEPTGADFERRADAMHALLSQLAETSKQLPATQKYIATVRQFVARSDATRAKDIENLVAQCRAKKWKAAETDLYQMYDRLEVGTIYLTPDENQRIYSPFVNVESAIRNAMNELRSAKAKQILQFAHKEALPHYSSILAAMNLSIKEIETKDTAAWKGEHLSTPQLVTKFGDAWRDAQVGAHKARGIWWALKSRRHAGLSESTSPTAEEQSSDKAAEEYNAFSQQVKACFTRLIDTETARLKTEEVPGKYVELLQTLAPIVRETDSVEFGDSLQQSLAKLIAKDPALEQQVKAYDATTSDLLRWRARVAATRAAQQATEFPPAEQRFVAGTMSQEDYTGLFTEGAGARLPQLMSPAPDVMAGAVKRLMGQAVTVRDVVRQPGESKSAISRYIARTYTEVPAPLQLESELTALEQDLLVTADAPPLTFAATQAVMTGQRGDMIAVGGNISEMYLENVITCFASLQNSEAALTVLGQMVPEPIDSASMQHVVMRFVITPRWAQHDYFFVSLVPGPELTAAVLLGTNLSHR